MKAKLPKVNLKSPKEFWAPRLFSKRHLSKATFFRRHFSKLDFFPKRLFSDLTFFRWGKMLLPPTQKKSHLFFATESLSNLGKNTGTK